MTRRRPPHLVLSAFALATLALTACGSSSGSSTSPAASSSSGSASGHPQGSITVFAAASLTEAFTTLGKGFQSAHPGTTVTFDFGASSALATQITQGAPADVFASASSKNMDRVVTSKAAANPTTFVKNVMEIAVPPGNPGKIAWLSDLAKPGVKVVVCQAEVPCGATAAKVFTNAKITVKPVSQEPDVKSALAKVTLGEADAAVVYVTDVLAAKNKVKGIQIPADVNASTSYPIAALTASRNPDLAKGFVDYVLSPDGASVLTAAGFEKP